MNLTSSVQLFSYFFIIDFETTSEVSPQEIVDIACLRFNTSSREVEDSFRQYVRPKLRPKLKRGTLMNDENITQEVIDASPYFNQAWELFTKWYKGSKGSHKAAFLTIDNWDISVSLRAQSLLGRINLSRDFRKWIVLKKTYFKAYNFFPGTLEFMMTELGLPFQGKINNAQDDARNAAAVVRRMLREDIIFDLNSEDTIIPPVYPSYRPDRVPYVPPKKLPPEDI